MTEVKTEFYVNAATRYLFASGLRIVSPTDIVKKEADNNMDKKEADKVKFNAKAAVVSLMLDQHIAKQEDNFDKKIKAMLEANHTDEYYLDQYYKMVNNMENEADD